MSDFPHKLKSIRIKRGMTQKRLADSLNVSQNAIYNWENGKREPNIEMIKKIAVVLGVSIQNLITSGSITTETSFDTDEEATLYLEIMGNLEKMNIEGFKETSRYTDYLLSDKRYIKLDKSAGTLPKNGKPRKIEQLDAAHAIPGAPEDGQQHDNNIMDDENF